MSRADRLKQKELKRAERKARRNDPLFQEARKVLLNQVTLDEDGHFVTLEKFRVPLWGTADGENRTRFLGVSRKTFFYSCDQNNTQAVYRAGKTMGNIGRGINLRTDENAVACLVKTYIFYPTVLIFRETDDEELALTAYTPRTFSSLLAIKLSVIKFDKAADGLLERVGQEENFIDKIREAHYKRRHKKDKANDDDEDDVWRNPDDEITDDDFISDDEDEETEEDEELEADESEDNESEDNES